MAVSRNSLLQALRSILAVGAIYSVRAVASEPAATLPTPAVPGLWRSTLALIFVVAVILGIAALLKRRGWGRTNHSQYLRVVTTCSLGHKERLAVVRAGERYLLVGVTPSGITALGDVSGAESVLGGDKTGFSELLAQRFRQ